MRIFTYRLTARELCSNAIVLSWWLVFLVAMEFNRSSLVSELYAQLTPFSVFLCILAHFAFLFGTQVIHYRFFHPLSKFPGPFWPSVTRFWVVYIDLRGIESEAINDLQAKYGPIVRISPTLLHVNEARMLPDIYHRTADKSPGYISGFFGNTEVMFTLRDSREHASYRKIIASEYSFTNIKIFEPLIDARVEEWMARMYTVFADTGKPCLFSRWTIYLAYDVIADFGFGSPLGCVATGSDVDGLIQSFEDGLPYAGIPGKIYPFTNWAKETWFGKRLLMTSPTDKSGIGVMMRARDRLFEKRISDIESGKLNGRVDLLQAYLDARTEDGQSLSHDYIKAEILSFLIAGADTTGNAIVSLVILALRHPRVHKAIVAELDAVMAAGHLSTPTPQWGEVLGHCPYLVACVRETLRLHGPAAGIMPRLVAKDGLWLSERYVPPGTEVTSSPRIANRDRKLYAPDPDAFRPERWLNEEAAREYERYSLTFGYGARACIGKYIALMEIYKVAVQVSESPSGDYDPIFSAALRPASLDPRSFSCWGCH